MHVRTIMTRLSSVVLDNTHSANVDNLRKVNYFAALFQIDPTTTSNKVWMIENTKFPWRNPSKIVNFFSPVNITEKTKKFLHQTEELKPDLSDLPKPQYENQAQSDINTPDIRQGKC